MYFDKAKLQWVLWSAGLSIFKIPKGQLMQDVIVPTIDYIRNSYLLQYMCQYKTHFLVVGQTGTGKTSTILQ